MATKAHPPSRQLSASKLMEITATDRMNFGKLSVHVTVDYFSLYTMVDPLKSETPSVVAARINDKGRKFGLQKEFPQTMDLVSDLSRPVAKGWYRGGKCHPMARGCQLFATLGNFLCILLIALSLWLRRNLLKLWISLILVFVTY